VVAIAEIVRLYAKRSQLFCNPVVVETSVAFT